ncbi:hypothetical protein Q4534_08360 [Cyclobacterium sp. 1_MG-2023]|uniref:hypothetical protein n=1 Tax=Cyclobacterium sp. 1_MG-2023 TaxID=3062681 RepID=UPI0026E2D23E|nr:hypothetical protein [Cyclobacterium sp. 1_MG-2023]MDO6437414.1 hypothetical protein [Cyclobacterium sp. 1_MG-2023]
MKTSIVVMMIVVASQLASCGKKPVDSQIENSVEEFENESLPLDSEDSIELEEIEITEQ